MNYISFVNQLYTTYPKLQRIIAALKQVGALPVLVGGAIRDLFLHEQTKDFDIEVYYISQDQLHTLLANFGSVDLVGKAFGVLKLHGMPIDWSLPRQDTAGRKPNVIIDENLSFYDAFIRRDLTINAMGINLITGELIDPFYGKKDLDAKTLRTPDPNFFVQDPLRFFRIMQFIGRFEMQPDIELNKICASMNFAGVSRERISDEFEKLFLKSRFPSKGIRWLDAIGRLHEIIPELDRLKTIQQKPIYHPEGSVFEHTMQAVDAASRIVTSYQSKKTKLTLILAALCHDIGKKGGENEHGHDITGTTIVPSLLSRITIAKEYTNAVQKLVRWHMAPLLLVKQNSSLSGYKRLANNVAPEVNLLLLADLSLADRQGRNPHSPVPLSGTIEDIEQFKKHAEEAGVLYAPEAAILQGRDLIDLVPAGKLLGELLREAYEIQIEDGVCDKKILKERVLANFK